MKDVFISYSSKDIAHAEMIKNILEQNRISAWMAPNDIPTGSNYSKEIPIAIGECKVFIVILSKNAQQSDWVWRELDTAINKGKKIMPVMLENFILNDEFNFLLTGAQRYMAYQKKAKSLEDLVKEVQLTIGLKETETQEESKTQTDTETQTEAKVKTKFQVNRWIKSVLET